MRSLLSRLVARFPDLVKHLLLTTETHAFCAALAFFAMLAFYPTSLLALSTAKHALRSSEAQQVIVEALRIYYPEAQEFLVRNLRASVALHGREYATHAFWILLGAAGIFIPLETAFNKALGFPEHRPYWRNQAVGLLLTLACAALVLLGVMTLAPLFSWLRWLFGEGAFAFLTRQLLLRLAVLLLSIVAIFLFYRFLPNGRVRAQHVLPASVLAGVAAELVRSVYVLVLPWLELPETHGPYYVSVSFILLAYFEAFVLMGGAFLAADAAEVAAASAALEGQGQAPS